MIDHFVPILLCDDISVVLLTHNTIIHACTKHIELDIHFVSEKVMANQLQIQNVPTHTQIVDVLTKPLPTTMFTDS